MNRLTAKSVGQLALLTCVLLGLSACDVLEKTVEKLFPSLFPTYTVIGPSVSVSDAEALASSLGIDADIREPSGKLYFIDPERFQRLPMIQLDQTSVNEEGLASRHEGFDFEAIRALPVFDPQIAENLAITALSTVDLIPSGELLVSHSRFEAVTQDGANVVEKELDTQIIFRELTPDGTPLIGPGSDIKVVFDGQGEVVQLVYASRALRKNRDIEVLSRSEADGRALEALADQGFETLSLLPQNCIDSAQISEGLCLESELIYYAPPMEEDVMEIVPHYLYTARIVLEGEEITVRRILVPAEAAAPQLSLTASEVDGQIQAQATVSGGLAPYRYSWSSTTADVSAFQGDSISYQPTSRLEQPQEVITVRVEDANSSRVVASRSVALSVPVERLHTQQLSGDFSVGVEWVGASQGLPDAAKNVSGFIERVAEESNTRIAFNNGELNAFALDFIDPSKGGDDDQFMDAVDLGFYTGHATGGGIAFSTDQESQFLFYDEVRWGNTDLEWMVIAACGPMQDNYFGLTWWERWGPAFDGLHLLLAYSTITYDNTQEGALFANYTFDFAYPLRQAWVFTATDVQGPDEIYTVMGVWAEDGVNNYNDHFWEQGQVGPDIGSSSIEGFWRLTGPS